jgi:2-oxoglutarate dehydrogenase E2 component (dihydrolipoamide succinyltransferase)
MPQMGVSVAEGTVVEWRKQVGDPVAADEIVVEISTDKIETEVPAPASGVLASIAVEVGETVDVGTVLAVIETGASANRSTESNGHQPPVSPVVRRMADAHHLDLSKITGTGRRGRVTKKDVLAFLEDHQDEPVLHTETPYREDPEPDSARVKDFGGHSPQKASVGEGLSVMRKQIGEHMLRSLQTAAHCTTIVEADMQRVEEARGRLSYLPFVARAAIAALREHPNLNATLEGDRLTVHDEVHLGVAVSLGEDGLIVPVVRNAHELSHEGLAARIADLAERARAGKLTPDEVRGGTFTITNPGRYGALLATPIINQPQVAILDLEAVVRRPVVVGGDSIAIRPMTYLCMSWDHRALDGALAAQFLGSVRRHLEEWSCS